MLFLRFPWNGNIHSMIYGLNIINLLNLILWNKTFKCSCVFIPMFCGIFNQVWLFILLGGERVQMFSNCVNVPSFYLSWFLMFQMLILMIQSKRKQRMKWSVHKTKWHLKRIFQLNILTRVFLPFFPLFLAGFTFTDM